MKYFCCDQRRRNLIRDQKILNGIDFLEVSDNPDAPREERQRYIFLYFINALSPGSITEENVYIEGGERIPNTRVVSVHMPAYTSPPLDIPSAAMRNLLVVEVNKPGDFSAYTLRLVRNANDPEPPPGFDPMLSSIEFSFKAACNSEIDCRIERICPEEVKPPPEINYLAKDYESFRQLMLDRLAVLIPRWRERNAADLGIALIELLAYIGDYLSYYQDAISTEAYLGTARRRTSARRHARLLDYHINEGCNARVWVHFCLGADLEHLSLKKGEGEHTTKLLPFVEGMKTVCSFENPDYKNISSRTVVFELMHNIELYSDHNEMLFHTFGDRECCLPKGSMVAALLNHFPNLKAGDVLIFEEILGPHTGRKEDADPAHRHAVRLTKVVFEHDPVENNLDYTPLESPPANKDGIPITRITWHEDDALPFPLCISSRNGSAFFENISVARGNIVLADHGHTYVDPNKPDTDDPEKKTRSLDPDTMPPANPVLSKVPTLKANYCETIPIAVTSPRYRPHLKGKPLTFAAPFNVDKPPASAKDVMKWDKNSPLPAIKLREKDDESIEWKPKHDLLNSHPEEREFVVEIETDGTAYLRFGDDRFGSRPAEGTAFLATYRIGNGNAGNVGADTLSHIVSNQPEVLSLISVEDAKLKVRNPLPAQGGGDPENIEEVRQKAPIAFRSQERAVTEQDYADVAKRCKADIQRAAATFRWTGSWHTAFVTVDRLEGATVTEEFEDDLRNCLEKYRMAGQDLEIDGPDYVPLEIEMMVCVKPDYFTDHVKTELLNVFSNHSLPDGRRGLFHPDNFTFGQTVYLSPICEAAQQVVGVDYVDILKFQRQGVLDEAALKVGRIEMGRLEIARLDNDPNFPERGILHLDMKGGR